MNKLIWMPDSLKDCLLNRLSSNKVTILTWYNMYRKINVLFLDVLNKCQYLLLCTGHVFQIIISALFVRFIPQIINCCYFVFYFHVLFESSIYVTGLNWINPKDEISEIYLFVNSLSILYHQIVNVKKCLHPYQK